MPRRYRDEAAHNPRADEEIVDVSDPTVLRIDLVTGGEQTDGWVHTHGLEAFGLPELEIRGVAPRFLMPGAAMLLSSIADYMLNGGRPIAAGDAMVLDDLTCVQLSEADSIPGLEDHYQAPRWAVVQLPELCCPLCDESRRHGEDGRISSSALLN